MPRSSGIAPSNNKIPKIRLDIVPDNNAVLAKI